MICFVQIDTSEKTFDFEIGIRYEYLVKFPNGNHFVSVVIKNTWPDKGVMLGKAKVLFDNIERPIGGDILGFNESDIRGWLLLIPDQNEVSASEG